MTTASTPAVPQTLQPFLAKPKQLMINGQWSAAKSGETFDVFNPASGEVVAQCAAGDAEDIDQAVKAARAAGIQAIGFVGGSHLNGARDAHASTLRDAGAAHVFDRLEDVGRHILTQSERSPK